LPSQFVFRLIMIFALAGSVALASCGAGGLVYAQTPAPNPPAPNPPAPSAPEPTAAHLAAARELVIASGMSRSFSALVPQTIERLAATFIQTRPELAPDLNVVLAELKPVFEKRTDKIIDAAARIFTRLMSEAEIKAADAFFASAAGKKYVEVEPAFFNEVVNAMQDWQQTLSQDLLASVRDAMKKKGHEM
jgi:hypothetical protein